MRERFWNLPNTITMLRLWAVPVLVGFPLYDGRTGSQIVAWLFILAALGDLVDGWVARRGGLVTRVGKLLDPLADKLVVSTALIVLLTLERIRVPDALIVLLTLGRIRVPDALLGAEFAGVLGIALVVVVVGRELAVTGLRGLASAGGVVVAAAPAGKVKTLTQNVAVGFLLFPRGTLGLPNHEIGVGLLGLAAALTLWSGYSYFASYFGTGHAPPARAGREA